jgi:hypothetical protein
VGFSINSEKESSFDGACFFHSLSFPLKAGIPLSLKIPDPVRKTILFDLMTPSFKKHMEFL